MKKRNLLLLTCGIIGVSLLAGCNQNIDKERLNKANKDVMNDAKQIIKTKTEDIGKKLNIKKIEKNIKEMKNPIETLVNQINNICTQPGKKQACAKLIDQATNKLPKSVIEDMKKTFLLENKKK